MKKLANLFTAILFALSLTTYAETTDNSGANGPNEEIEAVDYFSFTCQLPEDESVHRFQALGYVGVNKDGVAQGSISLQLIKGSEIRSVLQFNDVSALGTFEYYEESDAAKEFHVLSLSTSIPYIRNINLIFKDVPLASSVLSIDYFNYRSDCKIIRFR